MVASELPPVEPVRPRGEPNALTEVMAMLAQKLDANAA